MATVTERLFEMEKLEQQLLIEINDKLSQILGLLAVQGKPETQQIQILRGMNFDWKFVGMITGLNADAARKRCERMLTNGKAKGNGKHKTHTK
jgi:hypothetical protein